ncbi:phage regulatory CII family protein [Pseudogulbenkiania ferrooxidans]|uniref:GP65 protein n=1 Tax=Pseudogulbenkiania ferrooxidans 2002 TaxID=279714 RepID=B9YYT0_9NEIS|nr:phage regulatory CII family protein [Pseudogulbenkiania ferrooxidans]EEG10283.1 GP65 protein [Pseudogulbenkiania ferrooxidans 2002]
MDVKTAAYRMVHDFAGGTPALAELAGIGHQVLVNKVNPNNTTHHLRLDEAAQLSELTGNPVVLFALAERLGFVCMPAMFAERPDRSPILALSGLISAHGDVGEAVSMALEDGRIDSAELVDIEEAILSNIEHLHSVLRAVRVAHRKGVRHEGG